MQFTSHLCFNGSCAAAFQFYQGFFVTISITGAAEAHRVFDGLSDGGTVRVPFETTFWSPGFGVLVDRFAIPWEVNASD